MATAGEQIRADLESSDFDSFLFLADTDFNVLASDDDSGIGLNSQIVFEFATPGEVFLLANSFSPQEGDYSLSLQCVGGTPLPAPIPTLSQWSVLIMALGFLVVALYRRRARQAIL